MTSQSDDDRGADDGVADDTEGDDTTRCDDLLRRMTAEPMTLRDDRSG